MQWSLSESAVIPIIMMITILRLSRGSMGVYLGGGGVLSRNVPYEPVTADCIS